MAALDAAIHAFTSAPRSEKGVDGPVKPGHDVIRRWAKQTRDCLFSRKAELSSNLDKRVYQPHVEVLPLQE
jgi:hypothetical protein